MGFFNQYIGAGGSSGATIVNMHFDATTSMLTIVTSDGIQKQVDLSSLKTDWEKLKDVTVSSYFANLVNSAFGGKILPGILDASGGYRPNNSDWTNVRFKVKPGHTYRLTHANSSSTVLSGSPARCSFFNNNDTYVSEITWNNDAGTILGNKKYAELKVPNNIDNTIVYGSCNLRITDGFNEKEELMIWDLSESDTPTQFIDFKKGGVLIGANVDKEFISTTGLTSKTVDGALDELNRKVTNNADLAFSQVQLSTNTQQYEFKNSSNTVMGNIPLMTDDEVQNIKNLFV